MGVNTSTICSCTENQKISEQNLESSSQIRSPESRFKIKMDSNISEDNLLKKSQKRNSMAISDIDTGDSQFESSIFVINKQNDDFIYEGEMSNMKRNGRGLLKTLNGKIIYDGTFKDDMYEGDGNLILENGFIYSGNFIQGKRNGKGFLFSNEDKYRYEGEWSDDLKSGIGKETYPDGSSYIGEFVNNRKNGNGIYNMNDGSVYDGQFKDDKLDGLGKFTWAEDKIYDGNWKNNFIDGFGIFVKSDKVYIGNFCQDKKHGMGLYLLKNGNILIGNFENGEIEGLAIIISKQGNHQLCFMSKSKVKIIISDENEKNNIKIGTEYKNLNEFYEENKNLLTRFETE